MPQYISYNGFGHPNESNSVIANAMGLLKLILHFWFFLSLTNIICVGVCGSIVHIQTVHTSPTDPNFTFLCSTSSSPFQSHWNLSSSFGLTCYKIKEKIKKRNLTCWDRQKICEKWYDISCIFISWMLPNWGIQIKAYISWSNNDKTMKGEKYSLIKWRGFDEPTWEPSSTLNSSNDKTFSAY